MELTLSYRLDQARTRLQQLSERARQADFPAGSVASNTIEYLRLFMDEALLVEEELRVQEEELDEIQEALEKERQRYRDLFEFTPEGYLVSDLHGVILEANQAAARLLNIHPTWIAKKPLMRFIAPQERQRFMTWLIDLRNSYIPHEQIFRVVPLHKEKGVEVSLRAVPLVSPGSLSTVLHCHIRDVTEQVETRLALEQKTNENLRQAALLQGIFETDPSGIAVLTGPDLRYAYVNTAFRFLLSDPVQDPVGRLYSLSGFDKDFSAPTKIIRGVLETGHPYYGAGVAHTFADGTQRIFTIQARRLGWVDQPACLMIVWDITEHIRAEEKARHSAAQLEVQHHLIEQREQERVKIAHELHDGPVQAIIASTYTLAGLRKRWKSQPELAAELEKLQGDLTGQIADLRAYAGELRTPIMDQFGLDKAIQDHLEEWQGRYPNIHVEFISEQDGQLVPEEMRLPLFRIYQEALSNVARHSKARHVRICVNVENSQTIRLTVEDDGVGFELPRDWLSLARDGHLGLAGIHERVEAVGGQLEMSSKKGKGTRISVLVPASSDPMEGR